MVAPSEVALPKFAKQVLLGLGWKEAMYAEFLALMKNNTLTLIPQDFGDNVINSLWIFKIKQREDGSVEKLKAHLVANGLR